jgi:hypothetical protein
MNTTPNGPAMLVMPTTIHLLVDEGPSEELAAEFQYDPADPYAVRLVVGARADEAATTYLFGRELLVLGAVEATGDGDVHIFPGSTEHGDAVLLEVTTEDDEVVLAARAWEIATFLDKSFELVGVGQEADHCDLDSLIAAVLAGAQAGAQDTVTGD